MAEVRFLSPFSKFAKTERDFIDADTIKDLCERIVDKYGEEMGILFDNEGKVSKKNVILVNRRGIHTLDGADTAIYDSTEVIIMPYLGWA